MEDVLSEAARMCARQMETYMMCYDANGDSPLCDGPKRALVACTSSKSQLAQYVQSRCSERIQEFSACLHRYKDTADERCQRPFALMEQCSSFAHADFIASSSSSTA